MSNTEIMDNVFLFHKLFNPYRLLILLYLKIEDREMRFHNLKDSLKLSDGNLASHLKMLEQEGYIKSNSMLDGKRLKTFITITPEGKRVLNTTIEQMQNIIRKLPKE